MVGSAQHELAKWLTDVLQPVVDKFSSHVVKDSFVFAETLRNVNTNRDSFMCSFDVCSLFTNVPLDETIEICMNTLYHSDLVPPTVEERALKKLLIKATKEVEFSFADKMFSQVDGIAMGSPLGPTLANIFLGYHESLLISSLASLPTIYFRYVDDCFAIFDSRALALDFLVLLNGMHSSLSFTMEEESNDEISFLDVRVIRDGIYFLTTVYRKPTFTGLYTQWQSFSAKRQKLALICSLTTRAKRICSPSLLSQELDKLRNIFISNGYPLSIVDRYMQLILKDREVFFGPKKCQIYLKLPWLGDSSTKFESRISNIISSSFPALHLLCCFSSRTTFSTTNKDVLPMHNLSNLVYSFTCVCERMYIGKTTQRLSERMKQHVPVALANVAHTLNSITLGGDVLSLPADEQVTLAKSLKESCSDSAITRHLKSSHDCLRAVCSNDLVNVFKVVARSRNHYHLDVLEAVFIKLHSPVLCQQKEFVKVLYLV